MKLSNLLGYIALNRENYCAYHKGELILKCTCEIIKKIKFLLLDGHFDTALELYSEAIKLNPYCAVYYGNRSFCSVKLENFGDALADANKALELDKKYIKVETRKGHCFKLFVFFCKIFIYTNVSFRRIIDVPQRTWH